MKKDSNNFPDIFPVSCHTKHLGKGSTFVVLEGKTNGVLYIPQALKQGVSVIVLGEKQRGSVKLLCRCGQIKDNFCPACKVFYRFVENPLQELAILSSEKFGCPAKKLKLIAITGTKGKTTTTFLIHHLLMSAGHKVALVGGVYDIIGTAIVSKSGFTTPTADYLHQFFALCVEQHIEYVVMEASSHAVAFGRLYGLEFEVIGFTNLGQDHLDYHHTMEEYFATKMLLFEQLKPEGRAFFNTDNPWGARAFDGCSVPKQALTFSMVKNDLLGLAVQINQQTFECPALFGAFNGENSALAITIAQSLGVSIESIKKAMLLFPGVPGRVQKHRLKNGATAFVDYAHNPSSFEAILSTLRPFTTHLIVVFGCGGNRDNTKRPLMGSITEKYADLIVLTDDNPRFEDRREIIKDVLTGIDDQLKVICEPDRANAIKIAAEKSNSNSIIALLGKGHENYYLVNGESYEFDDYKEITAF